MDAVDSLRVVCANLRDSTRDDEMTRLRRRLNRAHVENCRLRKKAQRLERMLDVELKAKGILQDICHRLIRQMDSLQFLVGIEHA